MHGKSPPEVSGCLVNSSGLRYRLASVTDFLADHSTGKQLAYLVINTARDRTIPDKWSVTLVVHSVSRETKLRRATMQCGAALSDHPAAKSEDETCHITSDQQLDPFP